MPRRAKERDVSEKLQRLDTLLQNASEIVAELSADAHPLLVRLGRVFSRMPDKDRTPILDVLEREVEFRVVAQETAEATGFDIVRPDPNARLYLRVFEHPRLPDLARDDMARAIFRAFRVMGMLLGPALRPEWEAAMLEAYRGLEPDERELVLAVLQEGLAVLDRADREIASGDAAG